MRTIILAIAVTLALAACSKKEVDIKSPCVGTEGSPCERRPVNDSWLS